LVFSPLGPVGWRAGWAGFSDHGSDLPEGVGPASTGRGGASLEDAPNTVSPTMFF
jgi:hypothetical protein